MNFYVIAALGAIILDPAFYYSDIQVTPIEVGGKRKRSSDEAPNVSPTMGHIDASLLKDAQDMIMTGLTDFGELKPGISPVSAARDLRESLDKMHGANKGLLPEMIHTHYFKQQ